MSVLSEHNLQRGKLTTPYRNRFFLRLSSVVIFIKEPSLHLENNQSVFHLVLWTAYKYGILEWALTFDVWHCAELLFSDYVLNQFVRSVIK